MLRSLAVAALVVAVLPACGDPRAAFVGAYTGSTVSNLTVDGKPSSSSSSGTFSIALDPNDGDQVKLDDSCGLVGVVTSDQAFTVRTATCPPTTTDACQITLTVRQGTGTRTGHNVSIVFSGDGIATCSTAPGQHPVTFTVTTTGSRP